MTLEAFKKLRKSEQKDFLLGMIIGARSALVAMRLLAPSAEALLLEIQVFYQHLTKDIK